jgi:release factor glutamine methyltransferase
VERVLADKVLWQHGQPCIADVGTGSGCITLAMAQAQPRARYIAIDISTPALTLARENARRCGIRADIEWREDDLLARQPAESLHGIIANLPYIPTAQWQQLPPDVRLNEPRSALDGGPDGLDVIRILTAQAGQTLLPGGVLWMEIGEDQGESVEKMLNHHGFGRIGIQTDLTNRTRFATGRKP